MWDLINSIPASVRDRAAAVAQDLTGAGVGVLVCDNKRYPNRLRSAPAAPPALFYRGPLELLDRMGVAVCGSRNAGHDGLRAAQACGEEAARHGVVVVSGYARGVDTEAHRAVLSSGGATVAVLAEGVNQFRLKRAFSGLADEAASRILVISQFPPDQPWHAGAATSRNHVIVGLGHALIVVEAGESGGTMRAGRSALRAGRPLWVLSCERDQPKGNAQLIEEGAIAIGSRAELGDRLSGLFDGRDEQLVLGE